MRRWFAVAAAAWAVALFSFSVTHSAASPAPDTLFDQAQKSQKDGKVAKAIDEYQAFVDAAPADDRSSWCLVQVGDLESSRNRVPQAMAAYSRAVKNYPDSVDARLARSRLSQLTQTALAAAHARVDAAKTEEARLKAMWELGVIYEQMDTPKDAAAAYRDVRASSTLVPWRKKAADKLSSMVEDRVKALAAGPPVPSADQWVAIADLAEIAECWGRAAEFDLKLADLAKDPAERWRYQLAAAKAYLLLGKTEKALVIYQAAIKAATGDQLEDATRGAGLAYENAKRWRDAVRIYDAYLGSAGASTTDPWAYPRKAECQQHEGDMAGAARTWTECVEKFPKHPVAADALLALGGMAEGRKDFETAKADYTRVADEFPGTAKQTEARTRLAAAAARAVEWEKVRGELSRMADKYPKRERKGD